MFGSEKFVTTLSGIEKVFAVPKWLTIQWIAFS